ncbi:MAG: tyrosine--tRNA ligase [Candidatus Nephthysia bennettiae]|nr:MAG: tyrosine--tRNA ligase [Candidatus Dormibacteraeota bacterium]
MADPPTISTDEAAIREVLERAVEIIEVKADLEKDLRSGRRLRVKLGIDPTGPRIHIGRAVTLRKMRQFQSMGHQAVLIIGDLTAQVGDASDKNAERPMLTAEQVRENMHSYEQQIGMILDLSQVEFQYNGSWLRKLDFKDVIELAKHFSVAQMITRENFRNRWEEGTRIGLHELLYPLMQGYDSVAIRADVEIGSTDQLFNVMAGRKVQEIYAQKPQNILLTGMIMGLDGRKMSKSYGNTIDIFSDEKEMRKRVMNIVTDSAAVDAPKNPETSTIIQLYSLFVTQEEVEEVRAQFRKGGIGYGDFKKQLFEKLWEFFAPMRTRREEILRDKNYIDEVLRRGAERANKIAAPVMERVRAAVGLSMPAGMTRAL